MSESGDGAEMPQINELQEKAVKESTLQAITTELNELRVYVPKVKYVREVGFADEETGDAIELATSEKLGQTQDRSMRLAIPYKGSHEMVTINKSEDGDMTVFSPSRVSLSELLHSPQIPKDLPAGITTLLSTIADSVKENSDSKNSRIGKKEYDHIWQEIEHDLDKENIPRQYDYSFSTEHNGKRVRIMSRNVIPPEDGSLSPEDGSLSPEDTVGYTNTMVDMEDDFSFSNTRIMGETSMYFRDETLLTDDKFPPLTEEDRKSHPFVVIPNDDTSENVLPYRVINADANGAMTVTFTSYFATPEEAQKAADKMYQREKLESSMSHEVTEPRAQHVLGTLRSLVEDAQKSALQG